MKKHIIFVMPQSMIISPDHKHNSGAYHQTMAAGINDGLWSLDDVIAKIDEFAPAQKKGKSYKK